MISIGWFWLIVGLYTVGTALIVALVCHSARRSIERETYKGRHEAQERSSRAFESRAGRLHRVEQKTRQIDGGER